MTMNQSVAGHAECNNHHKGQHIPSKILAGLAGPPSLMNQDSPAAPGPNLSGPTAC